MGGPVSLRNKDMFRKPIRFKRSVQNTPQYRNQRAYLLMQCNNKCEECGKGLGDLDSKGKAIKQLDLHHIKSFEIICKENNINDNIERAKMCPALWDTKNAIMLCTDCHKLTDSYGSGKDKKK